MSGPEPAVPQRDPLRLHWTQAANGGALLLLAALAIAGARACARVSWLLAPVALICVGIAALAGWGAAVQFSGGARMDDHPWV